jgi:hypothetical protein
MSRQRLPAQVSDDRELTRKQADMVDMIMTTGRSIAECAAALDRDVSNLYRDLRKPHVKKELGRRTLEHMGTLAPYAALTQQQLLKSDSDHVRASVAENILDRHLGKPVMRAQVALQGNINVLIDLA